MLLASLIHCCCADTVAGTASTDLTKVRAATGGVRKSHSTDAFLSEMHLAVLITQSCFERIQARAQAKARVPTYERHGPSR